MASSAVVVVARFLDWTRYSFYAHVLNPLWYSKVSIVFTRMCSHARCNDFMSAVYLQVQFISKCSVSPSAVYLLTHRQALVPEHMISRSGNGRHRSRTPLHQIVD